MLAHLGFECVVEDCSECCVGDCGGGCACATCHVFVDPDWAEKAGKASELEADMLDGLLDPQPTSRLSCQIIMSDALDGVVIRLPKSQL